MITVETRILKKDDVNDIHFFTECGGRCSSLISIRNTLSSISLNEWYKVGISLSCIKEKGTDISNLTTVLGLEANGNWSLDIGKVYLEGGTGGKLMVPCN